MDVTPSSTPYPAGPWPPELLFPQKLEYTNGNLVRGLLLTLPNRVSQSAKNARDLKKRYEFTAQCNSAGTLINARRLS